MHRERLQAQKERQEHAYNALLEAGQNPYAVVRLRTTTAVARAHKHKLAESLRRGQEAITTRLMQEESAWQEYLKVTAKKKVRCQEVAYPFCISRAPLVLYPTGRAAHFGVPSAICCL